MFNNGLKLNKLNQIEITYYMGLIFFVIIVIAIIVVKKVLDVKLDFIGGVIIGLLSGQLLPAWKYFFNTERKNPPITPYSQKTKFYAGLVHNQGRYIQGLVDITFKSEYIGKLKNGYFVNEISFPENKGNEYVFTH